MLSKGSRGRRAKRGLRLRTSRRIAAAVGVAALGAVAAVAMVGGSAAGATGTIVVSAAHLKAAEAVAQQNEKPPKGVGITVPLKTIPKAGSSICYPALLSVPIVADTNTVGLDDAAKVLGIKVYSYDVGSTTDTVQTALNAAINQKCSAYWMSGAGPVGTWTREANVLKQRGVPVLYQSGGWPNTGKDLDYYTLKGIGQKAADLFDWILADMGGRQVNVLVVVAPIPAEPIWDDVAPDIKATAKHLCPVCEVNVMTLPLTDAGTTAPSEIVAFLQAHPEYNWVIGQNDYNTGLPTALTAAGLSKRVQLAGFVGDSAELGYLKTGAEKADMEYDVTGQGWLSVDGLARGMTGQSMAPDQADSPSTQILTPKTVKTLPSGFWVGIPSTAHDYEVLWGCITASGASTGRCPGLPKK
jgi:hypothetical protein